MLVYCFILLLVCIAVVLTFFLFLVFSAFTTHFMGDL